MEVRIFKSILGEIIIGCSNDKIVLIDWLHGSHGNNLLKYIEEERSENYFLSVAEKEIWEYLQGRRTLFDFPIDLMGNEFEIRVWNQLLTVPYGVTVSYAEVAKAIGMPKGCRAVANAIGRNKINIVVPCHRIVRTDGSLGGYAGGIEVKKKLLEIEGLKF